MRYMMLYTSAQDSGAPPSDDEITRMGAFIEEIASAGVLVQADGLKDSSLGVRVRIKDGKFTVKDGPFSEAKEVVGGFAIVQVKTKGEAIHWAKKFLECVGEGESEVREMSDGAAYPPA